MLLSEASFSTMMRNAFLGFGLFWVVVLVALFFGVGFLMRKYEKKGASGHGPH